MARSSSYSSYYFFKRAFKLVTLEKATEIDAEIIFQMQVDSFSSLLENIRTMKQIRQMNRIERTISRINNPDGEFYKMFVDTNLVGAICISVKKRHINFGSVRCSFIPNYQGNGIAQEGTYFNRGDVSGSTEFGACYNFRGRTKLFSIRKDGIYKNRM